MKALKSFVWGLALGLAASCAVAFASTTNEHNGRFWNKLNPEGKDSYVSGYADAMKVSAAKIDALTIAGDLFRWKGSRRIIDEVKRQLSVAEIEPAVSVKRLDTLYRNRINSELDLGTALQLMVLRPAANDEGPSSYK